MRRFLLSTLALLAISAWGVGCQNVARIGCEMKYFYADVQRNFFGIDYPNGIPESKRAKYFGLTAPGKQPACDN
jgi:hypothetical protein